MGAYGCRASSKSLNGGGVASVIALRNPSPLSVALERNQSPFGPGEFLACSPLPDGRVDFEAPPSGHTNFGFALIEDASIDRRPTDFQPL